MEKAGRKPTDEGIEFAKKLDSNKDGKLEQDEVIVGDSEGNDYMFSGMIPCFYRGPYNCGWNWNLGNIGRYNHCTKLEVN